MTYHRSLPLVTNGPGLIFMASAFIGITTVVVFLRFRARQLNRQSYQADDWFALASWVFVLALNAIFIAGVAKGPITGHDPVENDWPVTTPLQILAQKYKYAFQSFEKPAFALIKISILFLWNRIFSHIRPFRLACWVMIGIVAAWGTAFTFATLFQCGVHWDWNWAPISFFLTQCSNTLNMLTVFTATDILTDIVIIIMPVPIIWGLQMPARKRLGISLIFMMGLFTVGAGIARMYIYLVTSYDKEDNPDFIADFTLFILWSEIEVNIAMIVCCMPTLVPIVTRARDGVVSSRVFSITSSRMRLLLRTKSSQDDLEASHIQVSKSFSVESSTIDLPGHHPATSWTKHPIEVERSC